MQKRKSTDSDVKGIPEIRVASRCTNCTLVPTALFIRSSMSYAQPTISASRVDSHDSFTCTLSKQELQLNIAKLCYLVLARQQSLLLRCFRCICLSCVDTVYNAVITTVPLHWLQHAYKMLSVWCYDKLMRMCENRTAMFSCRCGICHPLAPSQHRRRLRCVDTNQLWGLNVWVRTHHEDWCHCPRLAAPCHWPRWQAVHTTRFVPSS